MTVCLADALLAIPLGSVRFLIGCEYGGSCENKRIPIGRLRICGETVGELLCPPGRFQYRRISFLVSNTSSLKLVGAWSSL